MAEQIIHELKEGLTAQKADDMQPNVDAVTRKLFNDVAPAMVKINVDDAEGSGFILDAQGDVATDAHVVLGESHISVVTADGVAHEARMTKLDDIDDLAVVRMEGPLPKDLKSVALGSSKDLKADQDLWAFGHPNGWDPLYVTPGYFRHPETGKAVLDAEGDSAQANAIRVMAGMTPEEKADAVADLKRPMLNAEVNIQPGNSGGPLVDQSGKVVGISDFSNLNSKSEFTPVETLIALMDEKTSKFQFSYKVSKDDVVLTDISRTNGDYRAPFVDNVIVSSDDAYKPKNPPGKTDPSAGLTMERMNH